MEPELLIRYFCIAHQYRSKRPGVSMQAVPGFQAFQQLVEKTASADSSVPVFGVPDGQGGMLQLELRAAANLNNPLHVLGLLHRSPPSSQAGVGDASRPFTCVHIKSALKERFGADVADLACRSLADRKATIGDAREALSMAERLERESGPENRRANLELLKTKFDIVADSAKAASPDSKSELQRPATLGPEQRALIIKMTLGSDVEKSPEVNRAAQAKAFEVAKVLVSARGVPDSLAIAHLKTAALSPDPAGALRFLLFEATGRSDHTQWTFPTIDAASWGSEDPANKVELHSGVAKQVMAQVESARTASAESGAPLIAPKALIDCDRQGAISINGVTVKATPDDFAKEFRACFPEGQEGNELALILSGCMNQYPMNALAIPTSANSIVPGPKLTYSLTQTGRKNEDGSWSVRSHRVHEFDSYATKSNGTLKDMDEPAAAHFTIDFLIKPEKETGKFFLAAIDTRAMFKFGPDRLKE